MARIVDLLLQIGIYAMAIAIVLGVAKRLVKANEIVEYAKFLPGGEYHQRYQTTDEEEEAWYRAHA